MLTNAEALEGVMKHVRYHDELRGDKNASRRKNFGQGSSMGGFTVLYHAALYPPVSPTELGGPDVSDRVSFHGVAATAPMLQISPESRPNGFVEFLGNFIALMGAGRLPLSPAFKGRISDDPKVEFFAAHDPQVYHGWVRVATGLSVIEGLDHLGRIMQQIRCPVAIHHGSNDRTTSCVGSRAFFDKLNVEPKKYRLWEGVEHGTC